MTVTAPPGSEDELLARSRAMAGLTLGQLAERRGQRAPDDLRRAKGWAGQLIEASLGADAASLSEPDFQALGVELKTLPVNRQGQPRESTYVCVVPLDAPGGVTWESSCVWRKLRRVLWVPVEADPDIPLAQRRIGTALLWSPLPEQEAALRTDWEELMDMVCLGELEKITARHGVHLQIRPKAADSRALCWATGESGERILTLPRGFYLRPAFTAAILRRHYAVAAGR